MMIPCIVLHILSEFRFLTAMHVACWSTSRSNVYLCIRAVFWALFGAIYLCFGMPEVYRVLFEAFGMDPDDESCQPKLRRQLEDVDYVSVEFEKRQLTWQDVAAYRVMALKIIGPISPPFASLLTCYISCSHHQMLFSLIQGFSELVCHQACIVSEETFGILTVDPRSWTP